MQEKNNLILVGRINSPSGIRGNVIIKSFTDPAENIFNMDILDKQHKPIQINKIGLNQRGFVCKLDGCHDRNQAEQLKGLELFCIRGNLPPIDQEDEFYISDLIGLKVLDEKSEQVGLVVAVHNFGAGDIIEIREKDTNKTNLYPFDLRTFPVITSEYLVVRSC